QIICTRLNSAPDYDAVSYAWGAAEKTHCISVNGGYSLPITKSIATGLSDLVHACRTGYLWIDQICINQNNLAERNAQVTIMGDIYARSMTCLIWIGSS
ncbi:heterokaryon incompatibility, partial [Tothia fuscella]